MHVNLDKMECTCRRWDISGLPCHHAMCAIYSKGETPDSYVNPYFSKDTYMAAYNVTIEPIAGQTEWEDIDRPLEPPKFKRRPGRPKKNDRRKDPGIHNSLHYIIVYLSLYMLMNCFHICS